MWITKIFFVTFKSAKRIFFYAYNHDFREIISKSIAQRIFIYIFVSVTNNNV